MVGYDSQSYTKGQKGNIAHYCLMMCDGVQWCIIAHYYTLLCMCATIPSHTSV